MIRYEGMINNAGQGELKRKVTKNLPLRIAIPSVDSKASKERSMLRLVSDNMLHFGLIDHKREGYLE